MNVKRNDVPKKGRCKMVKRMYYWKFWYRQCDGGWSKAQSTVAEPVAYIRASSYKDAKKVFENQTLSCGIGIKASYAEYLNNKKRYYSLKFWRQ